MLRYAWVLTITASLHKPQRLFECVGIRVTEDLLGLGILNSDEVEQNFEAFWCDHGCF